MLEQHMAVLGLLLRASFSWVALVDLMSRWRTCLFKYLGGIKIKGNKRQFLMLRREVLAVGSEGKKKARQALRFWKDALFLEEVLHGVLWEAA